MARKWRLQFGLGTFLLVVLILGAAPGIVISIIRWRGEYRELELWSNVDRAMVGSHAALQRFRATHNLREKGKADDAALGMAKEEYYGWRAQVDTAQQALRIHFGYSEDELKQAIEKRYTMLRR